MALESVVLANRAAEGSGSANGSPVQIVAKEGSFYLNISAVSGTPTLDVDIEEQDPVSGAWSVRASFAQQTTTGLTRLDVTASPGLPARNYRASWTVGGTTPSFDFTVGFGAKS